jgi:hypothetical protein
MGKKQYFGNCTSALIGRKTEKPGERHAALPPEYEFAFAENTRDETFFLLFRPPAVSLELDRSATGK